jgi:quinol monooxygenase YgiN
MNIYLTAIVKSISGKAEVLREILQQMVVDSRKEEACLQYDLLQSAEDENIFIFHEIWEDQAGLDHHNNQPYLVKFQKEAPLILDGTVIIYKAKRLN